MKNDMQLITPPNKIEQQTPIENQLIQFCITNRLSIGEIEILGTSILQLCRLMNISKEAIEPIPEPIFYDALSLSIGH